jgi:hypothetical protein
LAEQQGKANYRLLRIGRHYAALLQRNISRTFVKRIVLRKTGIKPYGSAQDDALAREDYQSTYLFRQDRTQKSKIGLGETPFRQLQECPGA